ncbi:MAG TPA: amidohydrolase [Terriglobales bacterium]|nr:amidohydrolase [Terriglobales bacterium]
MNKVVATFLVLLMSSLSGFAESNKTTQEADKVFVNGDIMPGAILLISNDGGKHSVRGMFLKREQAIAVSGERILAVGSNAEIEKFKGKHTEVIDLAGHFVMPGFNDAHMHLASGGMEKLNVDLAGVKSLAEMQQRIAAKAKTTPPGEWITGEGWDHTMWPGQKLPNREDMDEVTGDHPAVFGRVDGHISVANSAALKLAHIGKNTADPPGGKIDRDSSGEPTGILREAARGAVDHVIPPPTPAKRREAIQLALADAASHGLTSIQDFSQWDDFLVYEDLEREGKLTARISEWLPFVDPLPVLQAHRAHHPHTDSMLHTGMLKGFMDGSLGSRTAALLQPYSDDPGNSGLPQFQQDQLNKMTRERVAAGFQIGFHAIGDRGVEMALEAFTAAENDIREKQLHAAPSSAKTDDFRFRIEHAQVVTPEQIARFRRLKVIASMQPNHLLTDMNWAESRIGPVRAKTSYAWKEFLENEVRVPFGTDFPVEPLTPFRGLYAAVTRENGAGTKSYFPEQKLTIEEAIECYTNAPAFAEFAENEKGRIQPGLLADFVVLDRDITKVPADEILGTQVLLTVVGGKTVYQAH